MNFYKITNENEIHHGLKYKTGLNIDPIPFHPSGVCEPGGIYFAREDILRFLDYGPWLRMVTLPEDAQVYKEHGSRTKWKADKVVLSERKRITAEVIQQLIDEGVDPKANDSYALRWAARNGHTDIVKLLIPVSDPEANDSDALRWAAENGHTDIVKLLIPISDPKACYSYALRWAAENGHTDVVKLLIPVSDPEACYSYAIRLAAENEHTDIVKLLIPVSDPEVVKELKL